MEDDRDLFRGPGKCELCHQHCRSRVPHHIRHRGMAGGHELNVKINLISVGATFQCECHGKIHSGQIARSEILKAVSVRERMTPDQVWELICWHLLPDHRRPDKPEFTQPQPPGEISF